MSDLSSRLQDEVSTFLESEIAAKSFPGAAYAVATSDGLIASGAFGHAVVDPESIPARLDTIWDLASLTKPLITALLALRAADRGLIDLHAPISKWLPEYDAEKRDLTFIDLLSHRSGFEPWWPLFAEGSTRDEYLQSIVRRRLVYPPRSDARYSDLGYISSFIALERAFGMRYDVAAQREILEPLGVSRSMFNPGPELKREIAATEWGNGVERGMVAERGVPFDRWRDSIIWGEVNDAHSYYLGGFAGSAGLFSTLDDVVTITRTYLGRNKLLSASVLREALTNYSVASEERRGLGWQLRIDSEEHPSFVFSKSCFGHTGFTGTSIWVDPERDLIVVLLTNRLHPTVSARSMHSVRRALHEIVVRNFDRHG
jgi:serine-type D-Ala-D-Ala carboxypeptidase